MKIETWYVLEDGNFADPTKCKPDKSGQLAFNGVRVKKRGDVFHTRSVDVDEIKSKDMKPEAPKPGYKTRESKTV